MLPPPNAPKHSYAPSANGSISQPHPMSTHPTTRSERRALLAKEAMDRAALLAQEPNRCSICGSVPYAMRLRLDTRDGVLMRNERVCVGCAERVMGALVMPKPCL